MHYMLLLMKLFFNAAKEYWKAFSGWRDIKVEAGIFEKKKSKNFMFKEWKHLFGALAF